MVASHLVFLTELPALLLSDGRSPSLLYLGISIVSGLYSIGGVLWARSRRLDTSNPAALAGTYPATLFVGIAMAQSAGLIGFALSLVAETIVPYLVGLGFAIIGLALTGPTRANLSRRQQQIRNEGSSLSLVDALMAAPPTSWRGGRR
jgi:predicted permease